MRTGLTLVQNLEDPSQADFEIVERKGRGHPDTLADRLAETLSRTYSDLCLRQFGVILRHQFDKLSLMGGKCAVRLGGGNFVSPVRLLINGRATPQVGDKKLLYRDPLIDAAESFLERELRNFDFLMNCRLMLEVTANTTRGLEPQNMAAARSSPYWRFRPSKVEDLPEFTLPVANDTAVGCGWAPYTPTETLVLRIERLLNADQTRLTYPWLGSDIKIMAVRKGREVSLTLCIPQISTEVISLSAYGDNLEQAKTLVRQLCDECENLYVTFDVNTADGKRDDLVYLLFTGSCVESGDEGQVGRGNRLGGVISSRRPFSVEGLSGKNPQYHAGKLYSAMAWDVAERVWREFGVPCEVFIVSQSDRPIHEPWSVIVNATEPLDALRTDTIVSDVVRDVGGTTSRLLAGKYDLS